MVPKKHRLILKPGKRVLGRSIMGQFVKLTRSPGKHSRLAVIVSKKVAASAVRRNRYRRRLQHIWLQLPPAQRAGDLVIVVKSNIRDASYANVKADIIDALAV